MNNKLNIKKFSIIFLVWLSISFVLGLFFTRNQITATLMINNVNSTKNASARELNFLKIKALKREINTVAIQLLKSGSTQHGVDFLKKLANDKWWDENLTSDLKIKKIDFKGITNIEIPKDEAIQIASISIVNKGKDQNSAISETEEIIAFFLESAAFIEYRNLINQYQYRSSEIKAKHLSFVTKDNLELSYLQLRKKNLLELYKQYPSDNYNSNLIFEKNINDNLLSFEKYLSLKTQLIALQVDIDRLNERLIRQNDLLAEAEQLQQFVDQSRLVINDEYNGLILHKKLRDIVITQSKLTLQNTTTYAQILGDIDDIYILYTQGLYKASSFNIKTISLYAFILAGLLIGLTNSLVLSFLNKNK